MTELFGNGLGGAQLAVPVPYFDANNGGANYLIRNRGPGKDGAWLVLEDATAEAGLSPPAFSAATA